MDVFRSAMFAIVALAVVIVVAVLVATTAQTRQLDQLRTPQPSGPSPVGRTDFTVRETPLRKSMTVTIWHPAAGAAGPGPAEAINATPAGPGTPVVIYVPGLGGARIDGSVQAAELASHGYAVVSMDDASAASLYGEAVAMAVDVSTPSSMAALEKSGDRHAQAQAGLIVATLNSLNKDRTSPFAGKLDIQRVGVLGYSLGGAAGVAAAAEDGRIVAVVNMDGWLFGDAKALNGDFAYLFLTSDESHPTATALNSVDNSRRNEARINEAQNGTALHRRARPGGYFVHIVGARHTHFSDSMYGSAAKESETSQADRTEIARTISALVRAFFDETLKDTPSPLLQGEQADYPRARWVTESTAVVGQASAPIQPSSRKK